MHFWSLFFFARYIYLYLRYNLVCNLLITYFWRKLPTKLQLGITKLGEVTVQKKQAFSGSFGLQFLNYFRFCFAFHRYIFAKSVRLFVPVDLGGVYLFVSSSRM